MDLANTWAALVVASPRCRRGRVLAPAPDRSIRPVDVRDLAAFVLNPIESDHTGVFNVAAPPGRETFDGFLDPCRVATGANAVFEWVDENWLVEQGIQQWTDLPLWRALPTESPPEWRLPSVAA